MQFTLTTCTTLFVFTRHYAVLVIIPDLYSGRICLQFSTTFDSCHLQQKTFILNSILWAYNLGPQQLFTNLTIFCSEQGKFCFRSHTNFWRRRQL